MPSGYRSRTGSLFGTGTIHEILTRRAYTGVRNFNEFARKSDGERKAQSEIVEYEIPAIIDQAVFEAVQTLLVSRHPRSKGPRLSAAPSLLGGLVRCDCEKSCLCLSEIKSGYIRDPIRRGLDGKEYALPSLRCAIGRILVQGKCVSL
jgi:hypothetical protein